MSEFCLFSGAQSRFFAHFSHPWDTVVNAAVRKYPNPMNKAITAIDVVRQDMDKGVLKTERILQSHFHIPGWAQKVSSDLADGENIRCCS